MSLNKTTLLLVLTAFSNCTSAGSLTVFNDPGIVAYKSNGGISGFYREDDDRRSCYFLFYQADAKSGELIDGYLKEKINTFVLNYEENKFAFGDRQKNSDIPGYIYKNYSTWVIGTEEEPDGCGFEVGGFTHPPQNQSTNTYSEEKVAPAIGIRVIGKKSHFYDRDGGDFNKRKGYLTSGDAVVVLQQTDKFSFVRFSDPRVDKSTYGKLTTGWVRSSDLVDPFPSTIK